MLYTLILSFIFPFSTHAWENHSIITKLVLHDRQTYDESVEYIPIERDFSTDELCKNLEVQCDKISWLEFSKRKTVRKREILEFSAQEPDSGMDQNLNLSEDQKYMGGYTGMSSQGFRHMYYAGWSWKAPCRTFHIPPRQMGKAPDRALIFLLLAKQALGKNNPFWAYRFMGWGLHYIQDLTQPYHVNQTGSLSLMPWSTLLNPMKWRAVEWNKSLQETTRLVGNYHMSFEQYVDEKIRESSLDGVFRTESAIESDSTQNDFPAWVARLIDASNRLAPSLVDAQKPVLEEIFKNPVIDLAKGQPEKLNFYGLERDPKNTQAITRLREVSIVALKATVQKTLEYLQMLN